MARSKHSIETEKINEELTLWFLTHDGSEDLLKEYGDDRREMTNAEYLDDNTADYLIWKLARAWYRRIFDKEFGE